MKYFPVCTSSVLSILINTFYQKFNEIFFCVHKQRVISKHSALMLSGTPKKNNNLTLINTFYQKLNEIFFCVHKFCYNSFFCFSVAQIERTLF